ncbi:TRAP transporter small permease [Brevibacterium jeotgali]|uniref:TRAP-type C4-dicarboxylate transport system, small permease component n=1 Tax=Brevibacterium jeotgali TaxID=1262550 RepID=A0A2H1L6W4_9MICO|nr:TRAP transporter small permease [Brevibacterium jeotgali]TWC02294.1 TRAP-type C4-dicarboxylate transport system permease small subunit [Brevibacterium jeotgali]SMY12654.1 TRAP-type C4-dicarboxylate transport system, small permease component [Brevibacterium jeotgali]
MKPVLQAIWAGLVRFQKWVMFLSCAAIIIGLFAEVICRYVLRTSIFGMNELVLIPAIWMYFMGASYAAHQGSHISANVLQVYLRSERAKAVLRLMIAVISMILGVIFAYWATYYVMDSVQRGGTTSIFDIPLVIPQSAVVLSFVLMVLYTAVDVAKAARDVRAPQGIPTAVEE